MAEEYLEPRTPLDRVADVMTDAGHTAPESPPGLRAIVLLTDPAGPCVAHFCGYDGPQEAAMDLLDHLKAIAPNLGLGVIVAPGPGVN